jgi:hypothetical protein
VPSLAPPFFNGSFFFTSELAMHKPRPYYTLDGVALRVGMTIWLWDNDAGVPYRRKVGSIDHQGWRVLFSDPDHDGYIGARVNAVFFTPFEIPFFR